MKISQWLTAVVLTALVSPAAMAKSSGARAPRAGAQVKVHVTGKVKKASRKKVAHGKRKRKKGAAPKIAKKAGKTRRHRSAKRAPAVDPAPEA